MSDDIKQVINLINDKELKSQLLKVHKLSKKIERIEKINKNAEKISRQVSKIEKIIEQLKQKDPEKQKKATEKIQKLLKTLSTLLKELQNIDKGIHKDMEETSPELEQTIDTLRDKLQTALDNVVNSIPPEFMNEALQQQLQDITNSLSNLQPPTPQQQVQPTDKLGEILDNLQKTIQENKIPKRSKEKLQEQSSKLRDKLSKGEEVQQKDLEKLLDTVEKTLKQNLPTKTKQKLEKIAKDISDYLNNTTYNNLQKSMSELTKMMNQLDKVGKEGEKVKRGINNFIKNPTSANLNKLDNTVKKASIPQELKQKLQNEINKIKNTIKDMKSKEIKKIIKNITEANTKLSNVKKNTNISPTAKSEISQAQKLLNQSMFNPTIDKLEKAQESIDNAIDDIRNDPNISQDEKDKLEEQLNSAKDNIQEAKKHTNNLQNLFKQPQMPQPPMPPIPMPPFPQNQPPFGGGQSQQGQGQGQGQESSGQQGGKTPKSGGAQQSSSGGQFCPHGNISQAMSSLSSLANAVSGMMESQIQNYLNLFEQLSNVMSGQQGGAQGGMSGQQQAGQMSGGNLQQIMSSLQQLAQALQQGNISPQIIQSGINQLQQLANMQGLSPTAQSMINSAINSLQNIQALQQLMSMNNMVSSMTSQSMDMIQQLMNSITPPSIGQGGMGGQGMPQGSHGMSVPAQAGGTGKSGGGKSSNLPGESFLNQELVDMLNKLSNANLSASQRRKLTKMIKDILKLANNVARESGGLTTDRKSKKTQLQNLSQAIKNNLHNLDIDDELLSMAQQLDDALGQDYSSGLAGGMYASLIDKIEKVDIDKALNQLVKMNREWIRKYRDLFEKLISEIIELKTKEVGYYVNPTGRKIDYRRTIRRTLSNAGIPTIVKRERERVIGDFIFILDASGSMHDVVELKNASWTQRDQIKKRLSNRLTQYQTGLITAYVLGEAIRRLGDGDYKIIVFANKMVDLSNVSLDVLVYLITNPEELNKYIGGGTNLRPTILEIIRSYLDEDMNVVLFTDTGDMSVWDTFTLRKLRENSKKVAVFCAGDFFRDTAEAFGRVGIPVFSFNTFEDLFELMKQYYIVDLTPEQAIQEVKHILEEKAKKGEIITSILPTKSDIK